MFTRYKTDDKGARSVVAKVYTAKEHNIHNSQIDRDCLWAIRRLWNAGHKAYIVGGAVRDMLLGRRPKDFDIATSASPRQVQNLFWNSRAIGKRFRIVHLYFANGKIIEVTTFRSDEENFEEGNNNIFGTIEQDSRRRDFSINALYYNPLDGHLIDFNDSMDDIRRRVIRSLIPLSYSFKEDPVRMIRALKYSCTTGFRLKWDVRWAMRRDRSCIQKVSVSRLTDEVIKIFNSGCACQILERLHAAGLLAFVMPSYDVYMKYDKVREALRRLDEDVNQAKTSGEGYPLSSILYTISKPVLVVEEGGQDAGEIARELFREMKVMIAPMTPPNYELERAVEMVMQDLGIRGVPSRRRGGGRRKPAQAASGKSRRSQTQTPSKKRRRSSGPKGTKVASVPAEAASSAEAHDL